MILTLPIARTRWAVARGVGSNHTRKRLVETREQIDPQAWGRSWPHEDPPDVDITNRAFGV